MAYYLHDKGEPDGPRPQTAERVAWTETRNLATDGPQTATRIMIATASRAAELKKEAGVRASGQKSKAHVYAYSLSWHAEEASTLTREHMLSCVDQTLKVLGAEGRQAVIVCHRDQPHPHVHVIVNRVHPETGKMLSTSNDVFKLGDWALDYRRARGEELKYCPKREEKRQGREAFRQAAQPKPDKTPAPAPQQQPQKAAQREKPRSEAADLKQHHDAQKARHKAEWGAFWQVIKEKRSEIYAASGERIKEAATRHKAETKAIWSQHFRESRTAEKAFAAREQELGGILRNALDATAHQFKTGATGGRGALSLTFANVLSSQARRIAFEQRQEISRGELSRRLKSALDGEVTKIKADRAASLEALKVKTDGARAFLIERQNGESAKMREAWKQVYERRGRDPQPKATTKARPTPTASRPDRAAVLMDAKNNRRAFRHDEAQAYRNKQSPPPQARQNAAPIPEQKPMKREFDKARELPIVTPIAQQPTTQRLSLPEPGLNPSGVPTPPPSKPQTVPRVDKAAEWAKTPEGRQIVSKDTVPPVRKEWNAATPATPAPAANKLPAKDWSEATTPAAAKVPPKDWNAEAAKTETPKIEPRKDWSFSAPEKPIEGQRPAPRDRSRDYDRER